MRKSVDAMFLEERRFMRFSAGFTIVSSKHPPGDQDVASSRWNMSLTILDRVECFLL
jgi:hypothetical protein